MKMLELFPKENPRRPGLHGPHSSRAQGDMVKLIKNLHNRGLSNGDILLHIERTFGSDFLTIATECIEESVHEIPCTKDSLARLKEILSKPITVDDASEALVGVIEDDELFDQFLHAESGTDATPIIVKWLELNMPQLLEPAQETMGDGNGIFSPLHGYSDPEVQNGHSELSSFSSS